MDQGEFIARLEAVTDRLESIKEVFDDHEKRIRTLETRQWYAMGVIGFILALAPFVFKSL